ncbi:unnamed protein product [Lactuca saligna]|uniref:Uncharacterized protein n=1 Tax=Lactuca saligna TaxID=75948 RepID=A0AA35VNV1_LACSI|nr:unnamed protein product [Lactuca saligna]
MYKLDTCSTESATNVSSSQHPEIERTYTSSDTSTRVVKKKKSSTKALVKRLLGVVAELSSKVDRVLHEKDEPKKRFVDQEEEEEIINEEDEEPYYHDTQFDYGGLEEKVAPTPKHGEPSEDVGEHDTKIVTLIGRLQRKRVVAWYQRIPFTVMQSTPKLKKISKTRKKKIEESPKKTNENIVNATSSDISNHLLLDSIYTNSSKSFRKE